MKYSIVRFTLLLAFLLPNAMHAEAPPSDRARGMFLTFGVGPRFPAGYFASRSHFGYGFNAQLDYTDTDILPVFFFGKIGFEQYPYSQEYFIEKDYKRYSAYLTPLAVGGRLYFSPVFENVVLIVPHFEAALHFTYVQELHQFKDASGLPSYFEENTMFGFSFGGGVSMFLLEITASYNYYAPIQYLSADLKIRLPLFVQI